MRYDLHTHYPASFFELIRNTPGEFSFDRRGHRRRGAPRRPVVFGSARKRPLVTSASTQASVRNSANSRVRGTPNSHF